MIKRIIYMIFDISKSLKESKAALFAASTAFFAFLSLIPTLILVCSILPFIHGSQELFFTVIESIVPASLEPVCAVILEEIYEKSITLLSVSAVLTLWTAGKGVYAFKAGINAIRHVPEPRSVFLQRIIGSLYTIVFVVGIIFSLIFLIYGNYLNELLMRVSAGYNYIYQFFMHFRFLFSWLIMTAFFQLVFSALPNEKVTFGSQLPGALFSSVIWSVFTWVFSIYVDRMNGFGMYGSLTTIIVVMMWLYMGFYILLIGVSINVYWQNDYYYFLRMKKKEEKKARKNEPNPQQPEETVNKENNRMMEIKRI